jgi:hypothetical protein
MRKKAEAIYPRFPFFLRFLSLAFFSGFDALAVSLPWPWP